MKPGEYFVEAVLPGDGDSLDFAEAYTTVTPPGKLSKERMEVNRNAGDEKDLFRLIIEIPRTIDVIADMVAVPVDEKRRRKNPLLPDLLYVDATETTPAGAQKPSHEPLTSNLIEENEQPTLSIESAKKAANDCGKRLPSAIEYDSIVEAAKKRNVRYFASGRLATMDDLCGGLAEWTTTTYDFTGPGNRVGIARLRSMQVLHGYGDPDRLPGLLRFIDGYLLAPPDLDSPIIGFRGVRSGAPRFVKP